MEPKIAVVVPVYNAEFFLKGCLDSILNQDFKDIKVICVNDASPDNCDRILGECAKKDNRVVVLNHDINKGAGVARNTGLDYIFNNLPTIEYISFIDADDKIEPNTYSKAYKEAKESNADILNFNFLPSTYWQYKTEGNSKPIDYEGNCVDAIFEHKEFYTFIVCWSKIYKKELLQDIRFSNQNFFEDGSFAYKVLPRAKKMRAIPDILYYYNIENPESTCGKTNENKRLRAIFNTMKDTINDWKKLGIYDKYKYEYIKHILLYTSMVCPNAFVGDYTKELNDNLGINILSEDISNNILEETQEYIKKMTKKLN
jgi:glycosyltransferase involved in cell wall biosynthesis